jgi:hypothetical protein
VTEAACDRDELIANSARRIVASGMEVPAVFALEMCRPLAFVAGQSLLVSAPFLAPIVGLDRLNQFSEMMGDRQNVERLLCRIEELAADPANRTGTPPIQSAVDLAGDAAKR